MSETRNLATILAADLYIRDSERGYAAVLLRLSGRRFADPKNPEPADVEITQDDLAGATNLSRVSVRTMLGRLAAGGARADRGTTVPTTAALSPSRDVSCLPALGGVLPSGNHRERQELDGEPAVLRDPMGSCRSTSDCRM